MSTKMKKIIKSGFLGIENRCQELFLVNFKTKIGTRNQDIGILLY